MSTEVQFGIGELIYKSRWQDIEYIMTECHNLRLYIKRLEDEAEAIKQILGENCEEITLKLSMSRVVLMKLGVQVAYIKNRDILAKLSKEAK